MSGFQNPFVNSSKRFGKTLEKSNFANTCNLLSQYVKERGSIKDLNLPGFRGKSEATAKMQECKAGTSTLNLLDYIENSGQPSSQQGKPVDPFVGSCNSDDATRKASPSKVETAGEPKRAQMTIFYAGKVTVFDDFPADKAKEIMLLVSSGGPENSNICGSLNSPSDNVDKLCSGDAVASSSKAPVNPVSTAAQELPQQPQLEANASELPIARRSSLHRFLAKRKDRAGARAPYQLHHNNDDNDRPESSSKNDQEPLELKLW